MPKKNLTRKQRRTFTLSPESLIFLEFETLRRKADSQSAVLDELLREIKRERRTAAFETAVSAYYDNLGAPEAAENKAWSESAGMDLALEEGDPNYDQSTARGDLVHENTGESTGKGPAPGSHRVGQRKK